MERRGMTGRQRLTKHEYAVIFLAQNGRCACGCGERLEAGKVDEEHSLPNYYAPGKPDALWRRECHKKKTAADKATIAKTRRLRGETGQLKRRKENGPRLKSRSFDKTLRKRMNGKMETRT
jgi:hypothetical protein